MSYTDISYYYASIYAYMQKMARNNRRANGGKGSQNATQEIAAVMRERIQAATKAFPAAG